MTRDDITRMAREAGSIDSEDVIETVYAAFSALVASAVYENDDMFTEAYAGGFSAGAAAEREACAKVCQEKWLYTASGFEMADYIRARGQG